VKGGGVSESGILPNVTAHMNRILGAPQERVAERDGIAVSRWADPWVSDNVVLSTLGMSVRSQNVPSGQTCPSREPRTELLAHSQPRWAQLMAEVLLDLAQYPWATGRCLFWSQVVPLGRPVSPGSALDGLFLTMPFFDADDVTFRAGDRRVDLVLVVPVASSEMALFKRSGTDDLEAVLQRVNIADLERRAGV
jgi:hypothetical protein